MKKETDIEHASIDELAEILPDNFLWGARTTAFAVKAMVEGKTPFSFDSFMEMDLRGLAAAWEAGRASVLHSDSTLPSEQQCPAELIHP